MAVLRIAERRRQRVGGDLQDGDPARQHEQAEQHQAVGPQVGGAQHAAGSRAIISAKAIRIVGIDFIRASSTAAGKLITP